MFRSFLSFFVPLQINISFSKDSLELVLLSLKEHADELLYLEFLQFIFYKQLDEVVAYAKEKGVRLMGDAPFYLLHDSAEVWSDRSQFLLDQEGKLSYVGGCMPEKFRDQEAEKFVLYDFKKQKAEEYSFWQKRMRWLARYYEIIRIEPFSAMDTYWRIPAEAKTVRDGKWIIGPRFQKYGPWYTSPSAGRQ